MFDQRSLLFKEIQSRGTIRLADILKLRRDYLPNGVHFETEAQALLLLNAACPIQEMSWTPFLVDAIATYIVHATAPAGYLTVGKARWLIGHASSGGRVERLSCLELMITVLEMARWAPPSLPAFVLRQIEVDIVTGMGPLRSAATSGKGRVGKTAAALIRRVLEASDASHAAETHSSSIRGALTRAEAEVLLDIHDATIAADNCLEWTEMFTKAMANVLMTASGYAAPARSQALQTEPWFDASSPPQAFIQTMQDRGFRALLAPYSARSEEDRALAHLEHHKVEIITAEVIATLDADWLANRLQRTATLTPATQALLAFLRAQEHSLHPALQPLLERAA